MLRHHRHRLIQNRIRSRLSADCVEYCRLRRRTIASHLPKPLPQGQLVLSWAFSWM